MLTRWVDVLRARLAVVYLCFRTWEAEPGWWQVGGPPGDEVRRCSDHSKQQQKALCFVTILSDKVDVFFSCFCFALLLILLKRNIREGGISEVHPLQAIEELEFWAAVNMSFRLSTAAGRSDTNSRASQTQFDSIKLCLRWEGSEETWLPWALWGKLCFLLPLVIRY